MCFLSTSLCSAVNKGKTSVYAVASYNLESYKTQLRSVTETVLKALRGWLPSVKVPVGTSASVPTAPGSLEEFQTQDHSSSPPSSSPRTVLPHMAATGPANFTDVTSRPPGREFSPPSPSTALPKSSLIKNGFSTHGKKPWSIFTLPKCFHIFSQGWEADCLLLKIYSQIKRTCNIS